MYAFLLSSLQYFRYPPQHSLSASPTLLLAKTPQFNLSRSLVLSAARGNMLFRSVRHVDLRYINTHPSPVLFASREHNMSLDPRAEDALVLVRDALACNGPSLVMHTLVQDIAARIQCLKVRQRPASAVSHAILSSTTWFTSSCPA